MINCREDKSDQYGNECVVPTFGGCWEAGAGVVTVHTSMTWSMGGGTWSFTSQMSSLRNFVSRFKYSLSFSDSSTPVCSGLWLALQENCRELGRVKDAYHVFLFFLMQYSTADVARAQAYLSNVKTDMVPLA